MRVVEIKPPLLDVAYNTNDLQFGAGIVQDDSLADRVLAGKMLPRKYLIDHSHRRRMLIILWSKETAAFECDAHYSQIARLDDIVHRPTHVVFIRGFCLPVEPEQLFIVGAHGNRTPRLRSRLYPWGGCEAVIDFAKGGANPIGRGVHHRRGKVQSEAQYVPRIKSRVYIPKPHQAAHHESSADEQHQGNRHLDHDKDALRAMLSARAAAAILERGVGVDLRRLQRRHQTEENPRQQRDDHGEGEHPEVDADFFCAGYSSRQDPERETHAPGCDKQSYSTSRKP